MTDTSRSENEPRRPLLSDYETTTSRGEADQFLAQHTQIRSIECLLTLATRPEQRVGGNQNGESRRVLLHIGAMLGSESADTAQAVLSIIHLANRFLEGASKDGTDEIYGIDEATIAAVRDLDADELANSCHEVFRPHIHNYLSIVHASYGQAIGDPQIVRLAVERATLAIEAAPETDDDMPTFLNNLAAVHRILHRMDGDVRHLAQAIGASQRAVELTSREEPDLQYRLARLLDHHRSLYAATGDRSQLLKATQLAQQAVEAGPGTDGDLSLLLHDLGLDHSQSYLKTGEQTHLIQAIAAAKQGIALAPHGDAELAIHFADLAAHYSYLHAATNGRQHLDEAIKLLERAIELAPADSVHLPRKLANLGNMYETMYTAKGDPTLLNQAIELTKKAIELTPEGNTDLPQLLSNLALHYGHLHTATGNRTHLNRAIQLANQAHALTPEEAAELPKRLGHLASLHADLYGETNNPQWLSQAVKIGERAAELTPDGSVELPRRLNNLALFYGNLHAAIGNPAHLNRAIQLAKRVVTLTPEEAADFPTVLGNLALHYNELYSAGKDVAHLAQAVELSERAVELTPDTDIRRPMLLTNLANRYVDLFKVTGEVPLLERALELLPDTVTGPAEALIVERVRAGMLRSLHRPVEAARALEVALGALAEETQRLRESPVQLRDLAGRTEGLIADLASCYIAAGSVDEAVEVLERERTWLKQPFSNEGGVNAQMEVTWVFSSQWDTIIITNFGAEPVVIGDLSYSAIFDAVAEAVNDVRSWATGDTVGSAKQATQAVNRLCDLTSRITTELPTTDRWLIVPVGICSQLPYTAGAHPNGGYAIDHATITIAATLRWANHSAHRLRPHNGTSLGVFHPGPDYSDLDLEQDRIQFANHFPTDDTLPTADGSAPYATDFLDRQAKADYVTHFSCHGHYNHLHPLQSALHLEDGLTIDRILGRDDFSWLVNLSACETGIPDLTRAEQAISFPTAFLQGGTAHVIASLWPISNAHATTYNHHFYAALSEHQHPADAHKQAIGLLRNNYGEQVPNQRLRTVYQDSFLPLQRDHPLWWASFTHHGTPGPN